MKKCDVSFADAMSGFVDSGVLIIVQPENKHKALTKY